MKYDMVNEIILHKVCMETKNLSQPSAYKILVYHSLDVVFRFLFVTRTTFLIITNISGVVVGVFWSGAKSGKYLLYDAVDNVGETNGRN